MKLLIGKRIAISCILFAGILMGFKIQDKGKEGIDYVPNAKTAIKVAEALWLPLYGNSIYRHRPFSATLENDLWIISGKVNNKKGGYPYAEIRKDNCMVVKITHYK